MKKKHLLASLAALGVITIASGATAVLAADTSLPTFGKFRNQPELTAEQKTALETRKAEMDAKFAAIEAALLKGDYNAWVTAQKALDADCPLLEKITALNFPRYVEANNLRLQADKIMEELGLTGEQFSHRGGQGKGLGQGLGLGRGHEKMTGGMRMGQLNR